MAIVSANSPEFVLAYLAYLAYLATLRLGAVVVPVNTRLAPPELARVLLDSGAALVLAGADDRAVVEAAASGLPGGRCVVVDGLVGLAAAAAGDPVLTDRAAEDDDALIVYTSGTTGRPKGVLHTHRTAVWAALAQITSLGMRDGERYPHLPPLHSGGVVYPNAMTLLGGTNVLVRRSTSLVQKHLLRRGVAGG